MIPEELSRDLKCLQKRFCCEITEADLKVYVVFKGFPLPQGMYNAEKTDLLIFTTPYYPNAGFDMFWTDPDLTLDDGRTPGSADTVETHIGREWRRFSYHPYDQKKWNPAVDNVERFVCYVQRRLGKGD